jgi:hypothetical protein
MRSGREPLPPLFHLRLFGQIDAPAARRCRAMNLRHAIYRRRIRRGSGKRSARPSQQMGGF